MKNLVRNIYQYCMNIDKFGMYNSVHRNTVTTDMILCLYDYMNMLSGFRSIIKLFPGLHIV